MRQTNAAPLFLTFQALLQNRSEFLSMQADPEPFQPSQVERLAGTLKPFGPMTEGIANLQSLDIPPQNGDQVPGF